MEDQEGRTSFTSYVAGNVRALRAIRKVSQDELATRMQAMGHKTWYGTTVGEVEGGRRHVDVDEFVSLCYALTALPIELLLPHGSDLYIGNRFPEWPEHLGSPRDAARGWLTSMYRIGWDQEVVRIDRETGEVLPPPQETEEGQ